MKLKFFFLLHILIGITLQSKAQESLGIALDAGYGIFSKSTHERLDFIEDESQAVYVGLEFEFGKAIASLNFNLPMLENGKTASQISLGLGTTLFNGYRVQFPIRILFGGWTMKEKSAYDFTGYNLGAKGGLRFYLTNKFAIHGMAEFQRNYFLKENKLKLDVKPDPFDTIFFELGITYSFISKTD